MGAQPYAVGLGDDALMRRLTNKLLADLPRISEAISARVLERQPELGLLLGDASPDVVARSTAANVGAYLSTLAYGVPAGSIEPPHDAFDLIDHIASDPEALPTLLRTYRIGAAETWRCVAGYLGEQVSSGPTLARLVVAASTHLDEYTDHIAQCLTARWSEWSREAARNGLRREAAVRALLKGEPASEENLDHPIDRPHLALAVATGTERWPERRRRVVDAAGRLLGGPPVLELANEGAYLVWLSPRETPAPALVEQIVGLADDGTQLAVSGIAWGRDGFRQVAREALDTLRAVVLLRPTGGAASFARIALVATLLADESRARRFAEVTLGALAEPTEEADRMRSTLRAYFDCGSSKAAAAKQLHMHEKTVAYRLRRAARVLGAPIERHRADLGVALEIHRALSGR